MMMVLLWLSLAARPLPDTLAGVLTPDSMARLNEVLQDSTSGSAALVGAAQALAVAAETTAFARLVPLLRHQDPEVRRVAAWALSATGPSAALGHLLRLARKDSDAGVRAGAVGLLRAYPFARVISLLGQVALDTTEERGVRSEAVTVLGDIGDDRALPALERVVADPDPGLRAAAATALASFWAAGVGDLLVELLSDDDEEVRVAAAEALAAAGETRAVPALTTLARRTCRLLPARAAAVLADTGSAGRRQIELVRTCHPPARIIVALAMLDMDAALTVVEQAAGWIPAEARPALVRALERIEVAAAADLLRRLAASAVDPELRAAARAAARR